MKIVSIISMFASLITLYLVLSAHKREVRREKKETIKEEQKIENRCPELSKYQSINGR